MLHECHRSQRDPHREPGDFDPYVRAERRKRPREGAMNMAEFGARFAQKGD